MVGLPCHIAALKNAKRYFRAQFFTIELFCGGVFSFRLVDEYCRNSGLNVKALDFRDKTTGWHDFSMTVVGENDERKSTKASEDVFFLAQRNKIFVQESCLNCSYAYNGTADIQVGDFWGGKFSKDEKGVNLVIARSKEAKELIEESAHLSCSPVSITEMYKSQPCFVSAYRRNIPNNENMPYSETSMFKHELNKKFLDEYMNYRNFQELENLIKIHKFRKNDNKTNKILIVPSDDHCGSFGDQAMLLALVGKIFEMKPGVDIGLFMLWQSAEDGFLLNNGFNVQYHIADNSPIDKRFAKVLEDYEQVVFIGADILDGGCGLETSTLRFAMMKIAYNRKKRVSIMGFSFNRTTDPTIINEIRNISRFASLYARDEFSFNRLKNIGCSNLHLVADMAFSFNENDFQIDKPTMDLVERLSIMRGLGRKILGVHVTCSRSKSFIEFFEKIATVLIGLSNVLIVLLPHDLRVLDDKYPDVFVNEYLEKSLREKGVDVLNAQFLPNEIAVKTVIPLMDVVISSRMHLAIASLSRNVPVLSFVYQDKFEGLYNFYTFKVQTMFDSNTFDICKFKESLLYLLKNDQSSMIKKCNRKVKELSLDNFSFLDE
ncbi:Coenzyme F420 hydrogenase/dehydrogenase, beta subunit C-terminal domain [Oxalobacter aliiformigenes]|uniref:Coenzyme F420 hydrogenase/dehydrogenase, beta subunit C-terminal domain n=2 Tax=Oxalobacter aliiformigenes TaxID=2946593 RepID=UPI0038B353F5